jgi:ADP-ribose pyrophosphatase
VKEQNSVETWIHQEERYKGKIVSLWVGEVRLDDGQTAVREVLRHPGGVGVVPALGDSVVLIEQFRVAIGRTILEIPAGKLEANEDPEACARRELEEEVGYRAGRLVRAAVYYSSVGFVDEKMHLFLAFDLRKTEQRPDRDERIRPVILSLEEVRRRLDGQGFEDSKTLIGLRELLAHLERQPGT